MILLSRLWPEDINVEAAISDSSEDLTYYIYNELALNTFLDHIVVERKKLTDYKIVNNKIIQTQRLSENLDQYVEGNLQVDCTSIDIEGFRSKRNQIFLFLDKKCELFAKTFSNSFYQLVSI